MEQQKIGKFIHELRKERELTQKQLADLLAKNPAPDKATQQLEWVAHMNSLKAQSEEIVLQELVYGEDVV